MPNLWSWFERYTTDVMGRGSLSHYEMLRHYQLATMTSGEHALTLLKSARSQADQLGEVCFGLFLSHWITEHLLWHQRNYEAALQNALAALVTFRKHQPDCPLADRLYINLLEAYTEIDAPGYRTEIEDSLAYVRANVPLDAESEGMMGFRMGLTHLRCGEPDVAEAVARATLAAVEGQLGGAEGYYQALSYFVLGAVALRRENYVALGTAAGLGLAAVEYVSPQVYLSEFTLWGALSAHQ
ncbi:MAG: hypothetical protein AAF125_15870, partial [Chloroflexota bacterium]